MKKLLLSGFVILTFVLYSFHSRHGDSPVVVKPVQSTTSAPAAQAPASSSGGSNGGGTGSSNSTATTYKDGKYTGSTADAYYGYIQVLAVISGGKLTDVQFLQYPNDNPNSSYINSQAMPYLKQEALQAQNANVNVISGATLTSQAFVESLSSALNHAAG
ncbi:MAG TPA: FMN-binding protein [Candidatus Dormibacteraeota bacterium]|nr:FMN-binding protein [Candidatus Dormibacteraeota bacterium]